MKNSDLVTTIFLAVVAFSFILIAKFVNDYMQSSHNSSYNSVKVSSHATATSSDNITNTNHSNNKEYCPN